MMEIATGGAAALAMTEADLVLHEGYRRRYLSWKTE